MTGLLFPRKTEPEWNDMSGRNPVYIHTEEIHNMDSPRVIVPMVFDLLKPDSVMDVGCGTGTFLRAFKECGVARVFGIDGPWVDKRLLWQHISPDEFVCSDLSRGEFPDTQGFFDLAVCLEVAEHLRHEAADSLVDFLTSNSKVILFSAAVPHQGGQNHVNEQWPRYWVDKFAGRNFVFADVVRPLIWNDDRVQYWYRQNIFLIVAREKWNDFHFQRQPNEAVLDVVHPELYLKKARQLRLILSGEATFSFYCKSMAKFFLRKISIKDR
jgi:SAM-dependent methyltransferase